MQDIFLTLKLPRHAWAEIPGGTGGSCPPHNFAGGGHNIKCPPHVFVVGRFFVEKLLILTKFVDFFFFFFFCLSECRSRTVATGTPNLSLKNCQRRWRCGKKSVGVPPPRSSAFLGVVRLWAGGAAVRKKH